MTEHNWFREYCKKTTSHCMQYLVMELRSPLEKLFWVLTIIFMSGATLLTLSLLTNVWINNPTVMFIENTESDIREIPFPTITICPMNQLRKWVFDKHMNTNDTHRDNMQLYQSLICNSNIYVNKIQKQSTEYLDYELVKNFMRECAVSCMESFHSDVKWQNRTIENVCDFAQPMISVLGVCYNINMMPLSQILNDKYYHRYTDFFSMNITYAVKGFSKWNLDDGYSFYKNRNVVVDPVPATTSGVTYYHRLRMMLLAFENDFVKCSRTVESGFVISLSTPNDYYTFATRSFIVPETYTKIQITPFVKKINQDLKWRSPEVRKCYLHNERKLSIFRLYTEKNCHHECIINQTVSMCGCITFSFAYLVPEGTKICGLLKTECTTKAIHAAHSPGIQEVCNCLPTCSTIEYDMTQTSNSENWNYLKKTKLVKNNSNGATIELAFKNPYFTAYKSASIINLDSLISDVGGILSLLLGINLINLFEILYVLILMVGSFFVRMLDHEM